MAKALSKEGHIVHLVTQEGKEKSYTNELDGTVFIHTINFNTTPFRGAWRIERLFPLHRIRYSMAVAKKIKEIQKKHKIDIIQSPDWSSEGFYLSLIKKTPLIVRMHGAANMNDYLPSSTIRPNIKNRLTWMVSKYMILNADAISSVSNNISQMLDNIYGNKENIYLIHNGIDQTIYKPETFSQRKRTILFVGRLEEPKGIEIVEKTIPKILKDHPDIKFIFAGKTLKYKNTQKTWEEHLNENLPKENLIFLGPISTQQIVHNYQNCLLSIFPSFFEGGGAASLEAMACGCPVIATRQGGFLESIDHEIDGLLIPINDPVALENAIRRLLKDDALRENISINAVQKITTKFNLKKVTEQTIQLYERILSKTPNLCLTQHQPYL
jgi:glycosyltransferase involved in cell wall biosynthesis